MAHERSARMPEAARAESSTSRSPSPKIGMPVLDGLREGLIARGEIGLHTVCGGLAAEDVGIAPARRHGGHLVGDLRQVLEAAARRSA